MQKYILHCQWYFYVFLFDGSQDLDLYFQAVHCGMWHGKQLIFFFYDYVRVANPHQFYILSYGKQS